MLEIALMTLFVHRLVGAGVAEVRESGEELLVATIEQVHLWVVEGRVALVVDVAVLSAHKAEHAGTTLRRELTMEDEHVPLVCGHVIERGGF